MINENILSLFKSHNGDPSFSIIITDIKQSQECNQDILEITVNQVDKPLDNILSNGNVFSKKLTIQSNLSLNDDDLYKTELIGYISEEKKINPTETEPGILSHSIEILDTKLKDKISIEYNKKYKNKPKIIPNIDKESDSLFRKYIINHITEKKIEKVTKTINGNSQSFEEEVTYYTGVEIEFIGLKKKYDYPIIGIIIIGDEE